LAIGHEGAAVGAESVGGGCHSGAIASGGEGARHDHSTAEVAVVGSEGGARR